MLPRAAWVSAATTGRYVAGRHHFGVSRYRRLPEVLRIGNCDFPFVTNMMRLRDRHRP